MNFFWLETLIIIICYLPSNEREWLIIFSNYSEVDATGDFFRSQIFEMKKKEDHATLRTFFEYSHLLFISDFAVFLEA